MWPHVLLFEAVLLAAAKAAVPVQVSGTTTSPNYNRREGKVSKQCPSSHPYAFMSGVKCCKTPWKLSSGSQADCDGLRLNVYSTCCPSDKAIDCSDDGRRCSNYDGGHLVAITDWHKSRHSGTYLVDLRQLCVTPMKDYPIESRGTSGVKYKDRLMNCGGYNGSRTLTECYRFDGSLNEWVTIPSLLSKRNLFAMARVNEGTDDDEILATGGRRGDNSSAVVTTNTIDRFDGEAWYTTDFVLPEAVFNHCFIQASEDKMLFVGGLLNRTSEQNNAFVYSKSSATWTDLGPMENWPEERGNRINTGVACGYLPSGKILIVGARLPYSYAFDPRNNAISRLTNIPAEWCDIPAIVFALNKVHLVGGCKFDSFSTWIYSYEEIKNEWTRLASLTLPKKLWKVEAQAVTSEQVGNLKC